MTSEVEASPTPKSGAAKLPWKVRLALGAAVWVLTTLIALLIVPKDASWRGAAAVFFAGISLIVVYRAKGTSTAPETIPAAELDPRLVVDLLKGALDRADRSAFGWLTVAGAAHSALVAGIVAFKQTPVLSSPGSNMSLVGLALLVLGLVCISGGQSIQTTRWQANRALKIATRGAVLGPFYQYVFRGDEESWQQFASGRVLHALGQGWIYAGSTFASIGYVLQVA